MKYLLTERQETVKQIETLQARLEELNDAIYEQVKDRVKEQGSTTINEDGYKVVVTIPQRVSWDEKKLRQVAETIRQHGDDPEQYIQYKLAVPESKYKNFSEQIRKVFEPARTVKPGKRSIKVEASNGS
ncbi:MAG: hypothetical protein K9K82_14230 [Desulfobacteraceae bacterium]|nr:hypothetical protein [Desulfobacteraceae bacterium]